MRPGIIAARARSVGLDVVATWPLAAALSLLFALLFALGSVMVKETGGRLVYALDDSYIQMAIAKTLGAHGIWGVTRYEFSSAGTSLLWPWMIAWYDRALTGSREHTPLILNAASAVLLVMLAYSTLRRHISNRPSQAFALAVMILATPLPPLTFVGMEHTLECFVALAFSVASVRLCVCSDNQVRRHMLVLTLVGAPLILAVRYDAASVVIPAMMLIAFARGWRLATAVALCGACPPLVFAAVAANHGWPLLPASVVLKQRLANIDLESWNGFSNAIGNGALSALVDTPALLVLLLAALALVAFMNPRGERRNEAFDRNVERTREALFLLVIFVCATLVHAEFGQFGVLYRYEAYLISLGIVAVSSGLAHELPPAWARSAIGQKAAVVLLGIVLVQPLVRRGIQASREVVANARFTYFHQYQWGRFFRTDPQDGGILLTDHLGAISYFSDLPIVDSSGLATLEMFRLAQKHIADRNLEFQFAERRGVKVALRYDSGRPPSGWQCVAGWYSASGLAMDGIPTWLFATRGAAAENLERALRRFAGENSHLVRLSFTDDSGVCAAE